MTDIQMHIKSAPILEESFETCSLGELFSMLSVSRQGIEITFFDGRHLRGQVLIKSGQLLSASTMQENGRAAFFSLCQSPGDRFVVLRKFGVRWPAETLGRLKPLYAQACQLPSRRVLMAGKLSEVSLEELLQIMSMSRQHLEVELMDRDGRVGSIQLKAGQILWASLPRQNLQGRAALRHLVHQPGDAFQIVRLSPKIPLRRPLGEIGTVIAELKAPARAVAPVMEGILAQTPLPDLLSVFALSQQLIEFSLFDAAENLNGTLLVKSGQLLAAESRRSGQDGEAAFYELFEAPGVTFVAHIREPRKLYTAPIASINTLLVTAEAAEPVTPAPAPAPREPLMEGYFASMPPEVVLMMIGTSQQMMEMEIWRGDTRSATLLLKGGQVLDADVAQRAVQELVRQPDARFAVFRASASDLLGAPRFDLESVFSRSEPASPPAESDTERQLVLQGHLREEDVTSILAPLALSRQYMELELWKGDQPIGTLLLKAGQVLWAEATGYPAGRASLERLMSDNPDRFQVYRTVPPVELSRPLVALHELMGALQPSLSPAPGSPPAPPISPEADRLIEQLSAQVERQGALIAQLTAHAETSSRKPAPTPAPSEQDKTLAVLLEQMQQQVDAANRSDRWLFAIIGCSQAATIAVIVMVFLRFFT